MQADLHTHTNASDGELNPVELVELAAQRGVSLLAVTDHDTTAGIEPAATAGVEHKVQVVPAIELSTTVEAGELHILGYGIDLNSEELQRELSLQRRSRLNRAGQIVNRLTDLGYPLPDEVAEAKDMHTSIGRPHIARALIKIGAVSTVDEAFEKFLAPGRPAYVPRRTLNPEQAITLVNAAGGYPVLAHPFSYPNFVERIDNLKNAGLVGIEVYYGEYSVSQRRQLACLSREKVLLPTGGSDFHGVGFREGRELGSVCIPDSAIDNFLEVLGLI